MEAYTNSQLFKRLQTFLLSPLPNDVDLSLSPLKLAEAGFVRPERSVSDEVECRYCGIKFSGWLKESPLAVHRTLSVNCPFLISAPASNSEKFSLSEQRNHRNELEKVTKQQFPSSESSSSRIFRVPDVEHPFIPKKGGNLMFFESFRLLTFRDPNSEHAQVYAEAGFMYEGASKSVFCVFCDVELELKSINLSLLEEIHAEKCPICPFVNCFDVGNISRETEDKIKKKFLAIHLNTCNKKVKYLISHPEFENKAARLGTFFSWPRMLTTAFPAEEMASCGFFYTGFNDKVKCYACGVGLYDWPSDAIPLMQHAKASPQCVFLLESQGREFVNFAQNTELIVEAVHEEAISGSPAITEQDTDPLVTDCISSSLTLQSPLPGKVSHALLPALPKQCPSSTSLPGYSFLNLDDLNAALACQYTLEQITHAITKFFILSCGRYPNKDLMVGIFKAADENSVNLREKTQEIITTRAELEVTKAEKVVYLAEKALFQAREVQFQVKEAQFNAEKAAYQQEIQATNKELQRSMIIQQHMADLERKEKMLREKDQMLEQKDHMIEQNYFELEMKTKELEDLQRHVKSLHAALESKQRSEKQDPEESSTPSHSDHTDSESGTTADDFPVASCKVCLVKRSQIMFRPCKHLCCCDTCAVKLLQLGQNCPICREPNQGFEKVYVI